MQYYNMTVNNDDNNNNDSEVDNETEFVMKDDDESGGGGGVGDDSSCDTIDIEPDISQNLNRPPGSPLPPTTTTSIPSSNIIDSNSDGVPDFDDDETKVKVKEESFIHPSKQTPKKRNRTKKKKSLEDEQLIRLALHRNPYFTCLDEEQINRFIDETKLVADFRPGQAVIVEGHGVLPHVRKATTHMVNDDDADIINDDNDDDIVDGFLYEQNDNNGKNSDENSYLYVIRNGTADVFYESTSVNPATLGKSKIFGEGGFIFGRNHSASIIAATNTLECFCIDRHTFIHKVLPSQNMKRLYRKYASSSTSSSSFTPTETSPPDASGTHQNTIDTGTDDAIIDTYDKSDKTEIMYKKNRRIKQGSTSAGAMDRNDDIDGKERFYMTMSDFLLFFEKERRGGEGELSLVDENSDSSLLPSSSKKTRSSIANAYQSILKGLSSYHDERNWITLDDFCFFHFLMARPDPEVDIAFILMDRSRNGTITRSDFESYLKRNVPYFKLYNNEKSEFVERHFSHGRVIRAYQFSQFLQDLQRELGRQAFLFRVHELAKIKLPSSSSTHDIDTDTDTDTDSDTDIDNYNDNDHDDRRTHNSLIDPHIGYLPAEGFIDVLKATSSWRLPDGIIDRLESLYCKPPIASVESTTLASVRASTIKGDTPKQVAEYSKRSILADLERRRNRLGTRHFAYVDFIAFQDLLAQLPAICNLIERACEIKNGPISPDDIKVVNRVLGIGGRLSRQQVDIIFELFDLDHDGYLSREDTISVCGWEIGSNVLEAVEGRDGKYTFAPPPNYPKLLSSANGEEMRSNKLDDGDEVRQNETSWEEWMIKQTPQFLLSSIAGVVAIFSVYPFDLVKTRMMNQRIKAGSDARLYHSSLDCLQNILRYEGFQGLYRGLLPPILAAGPEKVIKYTVHDLLRGVLFEDDASSSYQLSTEVISGGCAGACQLLVTNPPELVKIRMQIQGETARIYQEKGWQVPKGLGLHRMSFSQIVANFGVSGLYKGAAACLLRDIPFGAIYFPAYAVCMDYLATSEGSAAASSSTNILLSGTLAAVPAAVLTNPMDFVKTRLQVANRPGEVAYTGIRDCVQKVSQMEGWTAFLKGSLPRVCRIAPQFGISIFAYEKLSQLVGCNESHEYRAVVSTGVLNNGIESKALDAEKLIENIGLFKPPTTR